MTYFVNIPKPYPANVENMVRSY